MLEIGSCVVVQEQLVSLWMPIWIFNSFWVSLFLLTAYGLHNFRNLILEI